MKIVQNKKDGSAEIIFTWKEIWILIKSRKLKFSPAGLKDLTNNLMHILMEFNTNFNDKLQRKETYSNNVEVKND
jgi:hypothetical protein